MIRVARVFPESDITDSALCGGLRLEKRELHIRKRLPADRQQPERDADNLEKTNAGLGVRTGQCQRMLKTPMRTACIWKNPKNISQVCFGNCFRRAA
jgi:hypothetical protein